MKVSKLPFRSALALAVALAAIPAFAGEYSQTVFFGDSLTDSGHFRMFLPSTAQPVTGKFTTNPAWVWAEYVADYYGGNGATDNQGGENYAVGGARVTVDSASAFGVVPSVNTQVASYLAANGGSADRNGLYTVWGGANDIFAIAAGAPAQSTLATAATGMVEAVGTLQAAGARYVMVPTLPDMGLTPNARAAGAVAQATLTQLASSYNDAVFGGLSSAGYRVIPVDTFHLLQEIVAEPGLYGFRNATDPACMPVGSSSLTCNPTSYVSPDAAQTYVFADGVHPSAAAHAIIAQYALSILEAPRLQQVISHSATMVGRARAEQVAEHLGGKPETDGLRWWGGLRGDIQRYDHADVYDGTMPSGLFGVDWARGDMVFGGFAGYGRQRADFGNSGGDFRQSETSLGGFAGWYGDHVWVNGQVSYTKLDYDVNRNVQLGPVTRRHSGSPSGDNLSAAINAGYDLGDGSFRHGPVASLLSQRVKVDGYTESNSSASALIYSDQTVNSLLGSIGWQASYATSENFKPYARLTYDHDFESNAREVEARLQSMPEVGAYRVPGIDFDRDYGTLLLGARTRLMGLDTNLGVSATMGESKERVYSLFATLSGSF